MAKKKGSSGREEDLFRIAAFMLFDAMVFHEVLSNGHHEVRSLDTRGKEALKPFLRAQWLHIRNEINYKPVFDLGIEILDSLPVSPESEQILSQIAARALDAVRSGILLKHDFMGRIYHKLLLRTTGHYYATYYTSIPAAWILSGLIFRMPHEDWALGDLSSFEDFRIVDPACGSGTLLSASYSAIRDRYIREASEEPDLRTLHEILLSRVIYGFDVLDFAAHLSLTNLALHSDQVRADTSHIYRMPLGAGGETVHLGSLDFLKDSDELTGIAMTEESEQLQLEGSREVKLDRNDYDVVIMNPPFSRSAKPNLNFGYSENQARKRMQAALSGLGRSLSLKKAAVAGLTPFFMMLGRTMLKTGGRYGLVAPRSILSGVGTSSVRERFESDMNVQFVVSNFDPGDRAAKIDGWSWSENTDLGEVLLTAQKVGGSLDKCVTTYVNVFRKPRNEIEALLLVQRVVRMKGADDANFDLADGKDEAIEIDGELIATIHSVPQRELQGNWLWPCTFANPSIVRFLRSVRSSEGFVLLPSQLEIVEREHAMGRDIAAVKTNFKKHPVSADARLVLGHQAVMNSMNLADEHLQHGKSKSANGAKMYRNFGARLLVAERPHLTTEALFAMRASEPVLTTAFWELRGKDEDHELWLMLWLNSTYGFVTFLAESTSSQGDIFKMKKDQLRLVRVPPYNSEYDERLRATFEEVQDEKFLPFAKEFERAAKGEGPRRKLDAMFASLLDLPEIDDRLYNAIAEDRVLNRAKK